MLWSDFRAQLRRELEEPTATVWADESLLYWANEASKDIAVQTKCSRDWQYSTAVVGQSAYELPDHSLEVVAVYYGYGSTDNTRKQLVRQEFGDWPSLDVSNGTPTAYAIDDQYLYLRPAPDTAYEISYLRYTVHEPLDDDDDSMPFDDAYDTAISYYVRSRAHEQVSDFKSADRLMERYMAEIDKAVVQEGFEANAVRRTSPVEVY